YPHPRALPSFPTRRSSDLLQFALPGAVDRLRASRDEDTKVVALAATDPASPYGTTIPWPEHESRMARAAGAYVVLDGGELRLYRSEEHTSELQSLAYLVCR